MAVTTSDVQPVAESQQKAERGGLRRMLMVISLGVLILFALIETVPFVLTIANSFKCLPATRQASEAFIPVGGFESCQTAEGIPRPIDEVASGLTFQPTLEGYQGILGFEFERWFFNTVVYALGITLLRVVLDSLAGYALARMHFPGRRVMFFMVLGTLMIPAIVLLIPRFIILKELGLLNTYQGFIFSLGADAFGVFLMKQFFESMPPEIEEAAMVDGASRLTMFFRIVLPMATPALTALVIFSFQGTWNNFMDALIIVNGDSDLWNLPLGLANLRGPFGETLEWNIFLAGAVFTTLPVALLFFFFQRYFMEGISYSGLKG